ncbi:MAG: ABC transporter permease subunit [Burkholderiales bacterium]|nr:ABC transporter permease subunit [Burkholderiales bacterium]
MSSWELDALWLSLQVALLTLLITTPLAVLLASLMSRARWHGHWLLEAIVLLPMALPPAVIGFALLMGLSDDGQLGFWVGRTTGWTLNFYPSGAVLAASLMTLPLMVRMLRPAFEAIDPMLSLVAQTLGATAWRSWWSVTLPLAAPAVLSALSLGLTAAWGESGATLVLASALLPETHWTHEPTTAPLALMQALRNPAHADAATRLALVSLGVAFVAILLSEAGRRHWQRRFANFATAQGRQQP